MICLGVRSGVYLCFFFFQAEDGIRDKLVTGVQTCALPICSGFATLGRPPELEVVLPQSQGREARAGCDLDRRLWSARHRVDLRGLRGARRRLRCACTVEIGRASCRERVERSGGGGAVKEKT